MKLSVIVPTYNRAASLKKTLLSFINADLPKNLEVEVIVVDNNSTDETSHVIDELKPAFSEIKLIYLFEKQQGRSFAVNTGIKNSSGDLLSGIDDDIEIDSKWFVELEKIFRERWDDLDFVSGKILPNCEVEPPSWVEPLKVGVLCWRDFGDEEWVYEKDSPMVTGANGIFKKHVYERIGMYDENVGVRGKGFISGEDEVFFDKLLTHKMHGIYNPKLIVYHYVPAYRLDKSYYRQWLFGVGISRYLADTYYKPFTGSKLLGVPRWMYRTALNGVIDKIKNVLKGDETGSLAAENQVVIFAGYFYGKNLKDTWIDKSLQVVAKKFVKSVSR